MQDICAIIPAAGSGSRAGFKGNKLLQKTGGIPVLKRTVAAFSECAQIAGICVCVRGEERAEIGALLSPFPKVTLVPGGETRTASVKNALEHLAALPCPPGYVLVHDGARPFVSQRVIADCIETVRQFGSAVCALPCTDTAVRAESGFIAQGVEREGLYTLQTPQGFSFPELLAAYRKIAPEDNFTDDSGVYKKYVAPPRLFKGEARNRKLTFAEDFSMDGYRTGIGIDTHAFERPRVRPLGERVSTKSARTEARLAPEEEGGAHIVLGGVRIPSHSPLAAHSDGDVLCHAVMDALLSAAGLADIGHFFPDTDPQYAGADSLALLARVRALLAEEGFAVENVSAAIVAEAPRLAPHVAQMKQNLADVLGIPVNAAGIAAGTNEGLGYLGRGEGVTVVANVLIKAV